MLRSLQIISRWVFFFFFVFFIRFFFILVTFFLKHHAQTELNFCAISFLIIWAATEDVLTKLIW